MTTTEESQSQPKFSSACDYLFSLEKPTSTKSRRKSLHAWVSPKESLKLSLEKYKHPIPSDLYRAAELRKLTTPLNLSLMEDDLADTIDTLSRKILGLGGLSSICINIGFLSVFWFWLANQPKHYYLIFLSLNLLVSLGIDLLLRWRYLTKKETLEYYEYLVILAQIKTEW